MKNSLRSIKSRYFIFIGSILILILASQFIIQYDLSQKTEDARLINVAGRQRMLSQRISKVILFISTEVHANGRPDPGRIDTLKKLILQWQASHAVLLKRSLENKNSQAIDALLTINTPRLQHIIKTSEDVIQNPSRKNIDTAIHALTVHELPFLLTMEKTVTTYQQEAESKLRYIKKVEVILASLTVFIIILEFLFIFLPTINKARESNIRLAESNRDLAINNAELLASEEEIKSQVEQITELQKYLELRERQYRELVENAGDMIYELSEDGKFSFINQSMEGFTGYARTELTSMHYWDIVHINDKQRVINFYKQQREATKDFTYLEFIIVTKDGREIWVGQNVKMFFTEKWVWKVSAVARDITAIKEAENKLTESENLYKVLSTNTSVMICLHALDEEGTYTYVSPSSLELTGYAAEELIGRSPFAIIPESDALRLREFIKLGVFEKIIIPDLEYRVTKKDGTVIWVESNSNFITDESGNIKAYKSSLREITKRKNAEAALQASEQRFRLLSEDAPIGIFQTDSSGLGTYMNKRWCEIAGIDENMAKGDGWVKVIVAEDREIVSRTWMTAIQESKEFNIDFRFNNPKQGVRWVSCHAVQVTEPDGAIIGYIGTIDDITALKEAQEKLIESEKLYRLLSTNSKDLITIYTADTNPIRTYISPSSKDILGYAPEELIGKSPFEIMLPEDIKKIQETVHPFTASGVPAFAEYRIKKKDGSIIWLESNSNPFFNENGEMIGFQTSARDITQRRQFQEALLKAKEKAEDATRAKSQFLSMMSHEIRTPMNAIIGVTNLLLQDSPRDDQQEGLELLKFSGENLLTIINDILDFSKIEAGKIELENIAFDLHLTLSNIVKVMKHRADQKDIDLIFNYPPTAAKVVKGDQVRISQIVTNLLGNAIKFTKNGSVTLAVDVTEHASPSLSYTIAVIDTGIGIESEKIQEVFESFTQARSDTTRKFGGTGLGLSITKKLLNLMDSDVYVESEHGVGSKFFFTLNLEEGSLSSAEQKSSVVLGDFKGKAIRVLLVEDNRVNQIVANNFLKKWGIDAVIANNGYEAVERVKEKSFQLILMDLQMPELDGYDATRKIRAMEDPYFKSLPIIALTASAMTEIQDKILESGMNDFVSKPFQPEALQAKISQYVLQEETIIHSSNGKQSNLDIYSEGDPEFKRELADLLVKNVESLIESVYKYAEFGDIETYQKVYHKCKTTLSMLGDEEFYAIAEEIDQLMTASGAKNDLIDQKIDIFLKLSGDIIRGLEEEMSSI